jgi:hypothetical protein
MVTSTAEIDRLRSELESRFGRAILPGGAPAPERFTGFWTGIAAIDALLPSGIARGTLSLWTGEATAGRTAALRALALHSCGEGATVALVDAGLTLDATFACTPAGPVPGLWVVRPPDATRTSEGPWAVEALLRAGVFDLVILDGCAPDATQAHRLRALARERDAAVVVTVGNREQGAKRASARSSTGNSAPPFSYRGGGGELLFPVSWKGRRTGEGVPSSLPFRADVRLEFRRVEGIGMDGLMPGGRFRGRARVRLEKPMASAPAGGEREVEVVHEAADCLRSHTPAPDRSPGGR